MKGKFKYYFFITGWVLSVKCEIREDINIQYNGNQQLAIEWTVKKMQAYNFIANFL